MDSLFGDAEWKPIHCSRCEDQIGVTTVDPSLLTELRCVKTSCSPNPEIAEHYCPGSYEVAPQTNAVQPQACPHCGTAFMIDNKNRFKPHYKKGHSPLARRQAGTA